MPECSPLKLALECFNRVTCGDKIYRVSILFWIPNKACTHRALVGNVWEWLKHNEFLLKPVPECAYRVTRGNDNLRRIGAEVQGSLIYWFFYRKNPLKIKSYPTSHPHNVWADAFIGPKTSFVERALHLFFPARDLCPFGERALHPVQLKM